MRRVNLLRAHGSPTAYLYRSAGCRCVACRGQKVARDRAYRAANRGQVLEYNRAWREKNRESLRLRKRAYDESHRDELNARQRRYTSSPKGVAQYTRVQAEKKKYIYECKSAGCCVCRETFGACLDFHHIDPDTKDHRSPGCGAGWSYIVEEMMELASSCVLLCSNCHRKFHDGVGSVIERVGVIDEMVVV